MPSTNSPIIISQAEFDTYSNDWVNVVTNNQADDLARCFRAKKDIHKQNINFVYFSALQIAQLVSTVGAQHVKVRFLIIREADNYPRFALALFASDDLNGRLSAYYVSQQAGRLRAIDVGHLQVEQQHIGQALPADGL